MANNFFLNQDPLLFQNPYTARPVESEEMLRKQLNDSMAQYKMMQQQNQIMNEPIQTDYIGNLSQLLKDSDISVTESLVKNEEYNTLNNELTELVQRELINSIKWKINANPTVIKNIEKQTELIKSVSREVENEKRQNLSEINDYVKNYSNITFDEYRKIKNGGSKPKKSKTIENNESE